MPWWCKVVSFPQQLTGKLSQAFTLQHHRLAASSLGYASFQAQQWSRTVTFLQCSARGCQPDVKARTPFYCSMKWLGLFLRISWLSSMKDIFLEPQTEQLTGTGKESLISSNQPSEEERLHFLPWSCKLRWFVRSKSLMAKLMSLCFGPQHKEKHALWRRRSFCKCSLCLAVCSLVQAAGVCRRWHTLAPEPAL